MSWIDIVQSVGIIVTIILMIIQMRIYEKSVKASTYPSMMGRVDRINQILIEYPEVYAGLTEPYPGIDKTDSCDRRVGLMWLILSFYDELYFQYKHGFNDKNIWEGWLLGNIKTTLKLPYAFGFWKFNKENAYYPEFRKFIDEIMEDIEA